MSAGGAAQRHTHGNQVKAARILGITRGSVRTKIKLLGISIERHVSAEDEMRQHGDGEE